MPALKIIIFDVKPKIVFKALLTLQRCKRADLHFSLLAIVNVITNCKISTAYFIVSKELMRLYLIIKRCITLYMFSLHIYRFTDKWKKSYAVHKDTQRL